MVFGAVIGEVFAFSFLYSALSQAPYFTTFVNIFVLNVIIWGSDHANDNPEQAILFHIFLPILSLINSYAGFKVGKKSGIHPVISPSGYEYNIGTIKDKKVEYIVEYMKIYSLHLFIFFFFGIISGVNLVAGRYEFGSGGMSPVGINPELSLALGLPILLISLIAIVVIIYLTSLDKDSKIVTEKYLILSMIPILPWALHDFGVTTLNLVVPYPNLMFLIGYFIALAVFGLLAYYIKTPGQKYDYYYMNMKNTKTLFKYIILFHFIGIGLANIVIIINGTSIPLDVAYMVLSVLIFYSLILIIVPINNKIK